MFENWEENKIGESFLKITNFGQSFFQIEMNHIYNLAYN